MPTHKHTACVLGGGSFGKVITQLLADNHCHVRWWMRNTTQAQSISQYNMTQQKNATKKTHVHNIHVTTNIAQALAKARLVILAIPSHAYPHILQNCCPLLHPEQTILSAAKGIIGPNFTLMNELIEHNLIQANLHKNNYGLLSGPNIASEIAAKKIAASVIATRDIQVYQLCSQYLQHSYFRLFHNADVYGVALTGALKNIYAILAGLADSYTMGHNTKSALIVRATIEISSLATKLGANPLTCMGLAGIGDLVVTCSSPKSRNYQAGVYIGKGGAIENINQHVHGVVEGINTLQLVYNKAHELGINMPLVDGLHAILFGRQNYVRVVRELMGNMHGSDIGFTTISKTVNQQPS